MNPKVSTHQGYLRISKMAALRAVEQHVLAAMRQAGLHTDLRIDLLRFQDDT